MNFSRCTVIIPVRFDSQDRIRNFLTVLQFLKQDAPTIKVLVCEHDETIKMPQEALSFGLDLKHLFIQSKDLLFYKTRCINDAVKQTTTDWFAIWDSDVLLKPSQLNKTIEYLENGYETVYPYDGVFLNVPKHFHTAMRFTLSLDNVDIRSCQRGYGMVEVTPDRQSFGGCVFFNKAAFIKNGMANEYMVSYGPEDAEIGYRFRMLTKYIRVEGPLYHMDHVRNINSTEDHPLAQANHAEFRKILKLSKEELVEYVSSWKWIK